MKDKKEKNPIQVRNKLKEVRGEKTRPEFAKMLDINVALIRNVEDDNTKMSDKLARLLEEFSNIKYSWWRTGEGAMYNIDISGSPRIKSLTYDDIFNEFDKNLISFEKNSGYSIEKMAQIVCKGNVTRYSMLFNGLEKPTYEEVFNVFMYFNTSLDLLTVNGTID